MDHPIPALNERASRPEVHATGGGAAAMLAGGRSATGCCGWRLRLAVPIL